MVAFNKELLILVVGDITLWKSSGRDLPQIAQAEFCSFADLTNELIDRLQPEIILSPLVSEQFDVLDLVVALDGMNYDGRIRALTPPLPNKEIILREVGILCPSLDFDILEVHPGPKLRSV